MGEKKMKTVVNELNGIMGTNENQKMGEGLKKVWERLAAAKRKENAAEYLAELHELERQLEAEGELETATTPFGKVSMRKGGSIVEGLLSPDARQQSLIIRSCA